MSHKNKIFQEILVEKLAAFKTGIAIESEDRTVTYEALDKRSDCIAHRIIGSGLKKETFIGILVEDRIELITVMIGIIKAGCVFIPIETTHPKEMVDWMIESTNIQLIICDGLNYHKLAADAAEEQVNKPRPRFVLAEDLYINQENQVPEPGPGVQYTPEDKIYIYFTSGTTGTSKAIIGKNKSLTHFINWEIETFDINSSFRVSQFTNPGFDAFLRDVFVPLWSGGTICIPPSRDIILNEDQLSHWINQQRLHLIHCVPSFFRFLNSGNLGSDYFQTLRFVMLSGEKIYPTDLVKWYDIFGSRVQLVNFYGPTETTMIKTYYMIQPSDPDNEFIPIGKPMKGARVIILDKNMKACDVLESGELYIRTPYRTFGYYNDPGLNRERFIPNPFNPNDPDDLIYKTGDMARLLPDGNIELQGRIDRQVKIRGVRIEPEGIESVLRQHPTVKDAAVIHQEVNSGNALLIAYVTRDDHQPGTGQSLNVQLKEHLDHKLPDYLVPAQIREIKDMPRKPNLKVDYKALSDLFEKEINEYIAPRSYIEKKLVEIWSEILEIKKIGINNDFFELGGNSLSIIPLVSRIHKEFNVKISLRQVFEHTDIKRQAQLIRGAGQEQFSSMEPTEEKEYYPVSSAQRRIYILQQMTPEAISYNMPRVVILEGSLDRQRMKDHFKRLIERQESLRTSIELLEGEPVQRVHKNAAFKIEYFELALPPSSMEFINPIMDNFVRPFDLSEAPLFRAGLIKEDHNRHVLMVDMHHVISDVVSIGLLIREFTLLYSGQECPPLKLRYRDYAEWQHRLRRQKIPEVSETYWLNEFEGEIPIINLHPDFKRVELKSYEGERINFEIEPGTLAGLKRLAAEKGVTLFMLLLAIFNILLAKVSGQEDIIVGTPTAGRPHEDMEQILGMLVNTLVLRNYPENDKTFEEFLQEVKEKTLKAFENQDYQFDDLVKRLGIDKNTTRNPLFDVWFMMDNVKGHELKIPGLKVLPYDYIPATSKFDLALSCREIEERLVCSFEYCTQLFKRERIEQFFCYFKEIVEHLLSDNDIRLADIAISHDLTVVRTETTEMEFEF